VPHVRICAGGLGATPVPTATLPGAVTVRYRQPVQGARSIAGSPCPAWEGPWDGMRRIRSIRKKPDSYSILRIVRILLGGGRDWEHAAADRSGLRLSFLTLREASTRACERNRDVLRTIRTIRKNGGPLPHFANCANCAQVGEDHEHSVSGGGRQGIFLCDGLLATLSRRPGRPSTSKPSPSSSRARAGSLLTGRGSSKPRGRQHAMPRAGTLLRPQAQYPRHPRQSPASQGGKKTHAPFI
jgi:hypothetical protein